MKKSISAVLILLIAASAVFTMSINASGYYIHDPMENPKAAVDIIVNPDAVYGYSPNPESKRLGVYAEYDWSDQAVVEEMRKEREEYHESIKELYQMKADMEAEGKTIEEIARAVSTRRNEIRMEAYKDDPEGLEKLKQSNLETFGNENGGTPDYFYEKYGSWETVIEKAFSTNAGADACLGLYDKYFDTYIIDKPDETTPPETKPTDAVIQKRENPIKVTVKAKTVKAKKLKKKAQKVKAITVKKNEGKVSYKLVKSGITKKIRKLVKVNSKGVLTIKKWKKAKKRNYKIKVKITAKGNTKYYSKTISETIKLKIK